MAKKTDSPKGSAPVPALPVPAPAPASKGLAVCNSCDGALDASGVCASCKGKTDPKSGDVLPPDDRIAAMESRIKGLEDLLRDATGSGPAAPIEAVRARVKQDVEGLKRMFGGGASGGGIGGMLKSLFGGGS